MSESTPVEQPPVEQPPPPTTTPFPLAPPPWTCKCDVYWILFRTKNGQLPEHAYSPLEASHAAFSDPDKVGAFRGGQGLIMILRYKETPLGPYNEMIYVPGSFDVPGQPGKKTARVTRIYVDQKETTYNGRLAWNLPKHVVRFEWTELAKPTRHQLKVYAPGPDVVTPFFTATFQPFTWLPSFSFSIKPFISQPPLPAAASAAAESGAEGTSTSTSEPELVGTDEWAQSLFPLSTKRAKLSWVKVEQPPLSDEGADTKGWWPKVDSWRIGLSLPDASFVLNEATKF